MAAYRQSRTASESTLEPDFVATFATPLCEDCERVVQQLVRHSGEKTTIYDSTVHHENRQAFDDAVVKGCAVCSTIYWVLKHRIPTLITETAPLHSSGILKPDLSFSIQYLVPEISNDDLCKSFNFRLCPLRGDNSKSLRLAASYEYPPSTSDVAVANLAHAWLDGCTKRHLQCQYVNTGYQPPRLLDLSGDNPRLQTTRNGNNEGTPQPYATLSHCWGKNPSFLTLTASNIEQFSKGIPLQDLPRTFQDAVELCKRLHIWYIWIDSLCIIQSGEGSSRDWLHHVTEMGQIYNFCIVNIAATHAEDAHAGLYAQRSPENIRPAVIAHQSSHRLFEEQYLLAHLGMDSFGYHDSPLGRRGWVFQERLLSPRILHFAQEQVFWECSKSYHICETFPAGITLPTDNYYFQPPTVFDLPSGVEFDDPNIIPKTTFNKLIEEYTSRQLTYPDVDKFAAFAGVAEHFDYYLQDQYVAGIFRRYLPQALLWKSSSSSLIPPLARSSYRCPSWSWAKLDCKVEPFEDGGLARPPLATVTNIDVTLTDPKSPYGRIEDARITLRGRLVAFRWTQPGDLDELSCQLIWAREGGIINEEGLKGGKSETKPVFSSELYFDGVTESRTDQRRAFFLPIFADGSSHAEHVHGLVLLSVGESSPEQYERIGRVKFWGMAKSVRKRLERFAEREVELV